VNVEEREGEGNVKVQDGERERERETEREREREKEREFLELRWDLTRLARVGTGSCAEAWQCKESAI